MPLWQIDIYPAENQLDREGARTSEELHELGIGDNVSVVFARGFLVQGDLDGDQAAQLAQSLLSDSVTERTVVGTPGDESLCQPPTGVKTPRLVNVLPKPGVMDPVAASTISAAQDIGFEVQSVRTIRKYWISGVDDLTFQSICRRALSNDSIEQVVTGPLD